MTEQVKFWLNAQDRIVSVGRDWNRFARENGAPELSDSSVIGRPLLNFVSGKVTRTFVQTLLQLARDRLQPIELDCRCDSPLVRRYTRMRITSDAVGGVVFSHETLRTEARSRPVRVAVAGQRGRHTPIRCSMCNQVKPANAWLEPEHYFQMSTHNTPELWVIYGICDACALQLSHLNGDLSARHEH